ncbi:kinase-like domain-containing protein [Syncephalis pseudoplumigaleata]|uniref:non-specific serine/threonine protein kinase n=1 Tax=Syncephalis pseudoplumigaleata TaxID=1712513 RepID=A0A4V1J2B0_9FUNG|nr:kinase-like domain-containing protein [Syncephalis pseudoplumigaleata]|eukprot:RKP27929.1 kinase-like domain-containing protein [Syncephalis pseudoplumigaleata]
MTTQPPVLHYSFYTRHESDDEDDALLSSGGQLNASLQRSASPSTNDCRISVYDHRPCRTVGRAAMRRTLPVNGSSSSNGRVYTSRSCHRASYSLGGLASDDSWLPKRSASPLDSATPKEQKLDTTTTTTAAANHHDRAMHASHMRHSSHAYCHLRSVHSEEEMDDEDDDHEDDHDDHSNDADDNNSDEMMDRVHALAELKIIDRHAFMQKRHKLSASHSTPSTPIRGRFASVDAAIDGPSVLDGQLVALIDGMAEGEHATTAAISSAMAAPAHDSNSTAVMVPSLSSSSTSSKTIEVPEDDHGDDDELDCVVDVIRGKPATKQQQQNDDDDDDEFPMSTPVAKQQLQLMVRHRQRHPDYIYHAPCEHYPCQTQTGYLVNDRCRKFDNLLSVVEFGVRAADCLPVTFKTVADTYLAVRELAAFDRVAGVEHVVQLIDTFLDDQSRRVFVFPRLRPLNWAEHNLVDLAKLLRQLLLALKHVHERGLVHLDVNPANMLQDASGDLVLIDFGLARDVPVNGPQAGCSSCIRACGTAGFIAPELLGMSATRSSSNGGGDYADDDAEIDILLVRSVGSVPAKDCDDRRRQPQQQPMRDGRRCDLFSSGVVFALALVPYLPEDCTSVRCLGSSIATLDTLERARSELIDSLNNPFRDTTIPKVVWHAMEVAAGLLDPNPATRWTTKQGLASEFVNAKANEFAGTELAAYQEARRMARYHRSCAMAMRNNYWHGDDALDYDYGIDRY